MAAFEFGGSAGSASSSGKSVEQKIFSQPAIDKLIYDALSADQGLASLVGVEGTTGSYNSSTKGLLAQDFLTKVIGEIATASAPTVKTSTESKKTKSGSGGVKTVICTELLRQGKLDPDLYARGTDHFLCLPTDVVNGYHVWAKHVVPLMQKSELLSNLLLPIVVSRYKMITGECRFTFWGAVTIYIGQPLCFLIGLAIGGEDVRFSKHS